MDDLDGYGEIIYPNKISYYGSWQDWEKSGPGI